MFEQLAFMSLGGVIGTGFWLYFLFSYFPKNMEKNKQALKKEIIEEIPVIIPVAAKAILNDEDFGASMFAFGKRMIDESKQDIGEYIKKFMAGRLGLDAQQADKAEAAIQQFITGGADSPIGGIVGQIAGIAGKGDDDLDFKKVIMQMLMPYIQQFLQTQMAGGAKGGTGARAPQGAYGGGGRRRLPHER